MIPDILEIVNLSSSSVVVNISYAQGAAIVNGPCRVAIVDGQEEILVLHEKDYPTIGTRDERLLNAGFFAACYLGRSDRPTEQLGPAVGLGIYQVCMLDRCTQEEYKSLMAQFDNTFVVTGHYKWMLKSLYGYGIYGHPLNSVP
ncbi:hypothetical protein A2973_00965 [Candidatus Gottesmanbacteria bacterium RIFCSPLOWO2_01_FULL_49_10]|uniref:Uncharacterized protein n=1 Tax=Candidatus Gottesmanbacteria bacterium RIFCSPLOWO2_01_FULL_49_10 TaxID=1798396 RepID=A0A1F6AXG0_9BACT|nr:MAG: hypothetical protein A2973_00965 [Candidatus Gottesmanbacteria bacterium RIFCSPLOWO2_01_FULL_49_10]